MLKKFKSHQTGHIFEAYQLPNKNWVVAFKLDVGASARIFSDLAFRKNFEEVK